MIVNNEFITCKNKINIYLLLVLITYVTTSLQKPEIL